jgi:hypothetical protein
MIKDQVKIRNSATPKRELYTLCHKGSNKKTRIDDELNAIEMDTKIKRSIEDDLVKSGLYRWGLGPHPQN